MKIHRFMLPSLIAFAIALSGCASTNENLSKINYQDSKQDVLTKLGPPENRQFKRSLEAWQYCSTGIGFGVDSYNVIWFKDDLVIGSNSYTSFAPGLCSSHFKSVNWEDEPDSVVEIRSR